MSIKACFDSVDQAGLYARSCRGVVGVGEIPSPSLAERFFGANGADIRLWVVYLSDERRHGLGHVKDGLFLCSMG